VPLGDSFLESLKKTSPQKPADDMLDVQFGKLEKKQRIWRTTLDNWYERVTYPFFLIIIFSVVFLRLLLPLVKMIINETWLLTG
jgi:hypothetical protein